MPATMWLFWPLNEVTHWQRERKKRREPGRFEPSNPAALDNGPEGGHASAALLASLLHDGVLTVEQIKADLLARGLEIRP